MAGYRAVHAEHINVVAKNLKVVAGVVASGRAFVMQHGPLDVGGHLQVAAEASWRPRSVAGITGHRAVRVCEERSVDRYAREQCAGLTHQFGAVRLRTEVDVARENRVARL